MIFVTFHNENELPVYSNTFTNNHYKKSLLRLKKQVTYAIIYSCVGFFF